MTGQTLGHYRILEKIGAGGMGEVYHAHDEQLDRDVALKVLPAGSFSDPVAQARLLREARSAAALNHPHICTIHEVGEAKGHAYIAMELVEGQPLSALLADGPLPPEQVVRYGQQLADALAHAHERGVVHRDLKSANVIITSEGRAKVLDFGLAKRLSEDELGEVTRSQASLTQPGALVGTLAYMAPEVLRGEPANERSDIWSLGVVLYGMATGGLPFKGQTGFEMCSAILRDSPAALPARVPAQLQAIIERSLHKEPGQRYQRASEVRAAFEIVAADAMTIPGAPRRFAVPRVAFLATGVAVVLLTLLVGLNVGGWRDRLLRRGKVGGLEPVASMVLQPRRSVAVLGFKNLSGRLDAAWLSTALSEMLTTELGAGRKLRTVPGENVARMKIELSLPDADSFAKDTLSRVRTNIGSDLVVFGSYLALGGKTGGQIRLDLRVQDAAAGETIFSVAETGTEAKFFDLVARTGARLRQGLGVGEISAAEASGLRDSLPSDSQATQFYAEGLAKLRAFDNLAARDLLEKSVAADPNYPLAHSALAAAWSALGYEEKAKSEAKKAFGLSANLSREEQLSVEAQYRETTKEWEKAVEIHRTLWSFSPDNIEYGLRLATAQIGAGKAKEALGTIELLRKLPPPASEDPRIDLREASAAIDLADSKRAAVAAGRAAAKARERGAQLILAQARFQEGSGLQNLGQLDQAKAMLEEAQRMYAEAGDRHNVAKSLNNIALVVAQRGDLAGARRIFEQALKICREIGNRSGVALMVSNLGNVNYFQGEKIRAKQTWEQALATYKEIGEREGVARMLHNISAVQGELGDLRGAQQSFDQALAVYRETGNQSGIAITLDNIGRTLFYLGELKQAKKRYEEALQILYGIGYKSSAADAVSGYALVLAAEGNIVEARKKHEEALAIRNQLGEKRAVAASRTSLAELSFEEGDLAEAETAARKSAEESRAAGDAENEGYSQAVLALALLAQGKSTEAETAIARATALSGQIQNRNIPLFVAITRGRVLTAKGKSGEATKVLANALAEASKFGFVPHQLEARLALGELESKAGNATGGIARLEALKGEALAKGFGLVARKAAASKQKASPG